MDRIEIYAPAKINLSLDVTGLREDGYHLLDTVMQTVSLADKLTVARAKELGVRLRTDRDYLPVDGRNTVVRAAQVFWEACGLQDEGLDVTLEKRIPSRAGLGGGSADAAAMLRALNELYGAGLPLKRLMELGALVGADVPFCVHGGTCRCQGVGEEVAPAPPLPPCAILICKPPVGVSTPRAYAALDRCPPSSRRGTERLLSALRSGDLREVGRELSNRFDSVLRLRQVEELKKRMRQSGALGAMMTGSGSAVYGLFENTDKAHACAARLDGLGEVFHAVQSVY